MVTCQIAKVEVTLSSLHAFSGNFHLPRLHYEYYSINKTSSLIEPGMRREHHEKKPYISAFRNAINRSDIQHRIVCRVLATRDPQSSSDSICIESGCDTRYILTACHFRARLIAIAQCAAWLNRAFSLGMSSTYIKHQFRAMNCTIIITIAHADCNSPALSIESDLAQAEEAVHVFEQQFSRFIPTSELSILNQAAGQWQQVSARCFDLVATALHWAAITNGLFDPTMLPSILRSGYHRSFETIAHHEVGQSIYPSDPLQPISGSYRDVICDQASSSIFLPQGMGIDLGGIGKGWIADQILATILADYHHVMMQAGGDIAARGGFSQREPWMIGVEDPRDPSHHLGGIALKTGGIATSGSAWRWWIQNGIRRHHLIDPRTHMPAASSISGTSDAICAATACAPTATEAEVYAKEAFLLGYPDGLQRLTHADDQAGILYFGDGSLRFTDNWHEFLAKHMR